MSENLTQGELKIQSLQKGLPVALFRELVRRVLGGLSSASVTNWLLLELEREHAGLKEQVELKEQAELKKWRYETLHPLVCALRARVQGWRTCPMLELAPDWLRDAIEALKTGKP